MPNIVLIQIIQYDGSIVDLTVKFSLYSTKQLLHFNIQFSKANISFDIRQSMTRVLVYHRLININHIPVFYYPNFYNYDIDQWTKNVIKQKKKKKIGIGNTFSSFIIQFGTGVAALMCQKMSVSNWFMIMYRASISNIFWQKQFNLNSLKNLYTRTDTG